MNDIAAKGNLPWERDDQVLRALVRMINTYGCELAITLYSGGSMYSGTAIPAATFFAEVSRSFTTSAVRSENDKPFSEALGRLFADVGKNFEKPIDASSEWEAPNPSFIHLRSLARVGSIQIDTPADFLTRFRLSSIDGFSIGGVSRTDRFSVGTVARTTSDT